MIVCLHLVPPSLPVHLAWKRCPPCIHIKVAPSKHSTGIPSQPVPSQTVPSNLKLIPSLAPSRGIGLVCNCGKCKGHRKRKLVGGDGERGKTKQHTKTLCLNRDDTLEDAKGLQLGVLALERHGRDARIAALAHPRATGGRAAALRPPCDREAPKEARAKRANGRM